jgi:hypothetical protein
MGECPGRRRRDVVFYIGGRTQEMSGAPTAEISLAEDNPQDLELCRRPGMA